jgi:hypothetical protein
MTLLVKDANTQVQPISTGLDIAGNLVPASAPGVLAGGVISPVSAANPMPTQPTGAPASDGSGTIGVGGVAQLLFGGIVPVNGYLVANNSSATLYVSDVGAASAGGASIPIAQGTVFVTPPGYKPTGAVSIFGASTAQAFAARRW